MSVASRDDLPLAEFVEQALVLLLFWLFADSQLVTATAVLVMAGFGFATVSPIQKLVMDRANAAGASTLAASVNIGMFNLGNAIGAWAGGATIKAGLGITSPILTAAIFSVGAFGLAVIASIKAPRPAASPA